MEHKEDSRRGKHLTREERMVIERMSRGGNRYPAAPLASVMSELSSPPGPLSKSWPSDWAFLLSLPTRSVP